MRNLSTKFTLLQQARDITRKILKSASSTETSAAHKVEIQEFIETTASQEARGIVSERWFELAVDLITRLNVTVQPHEVVGLNGIDLEVSRSSSPELDDVRSPESLRDSESPYDGDMDSSPPPRCYSIWKWGLKYEGG